MKSRKDLSDDLHQWFSNHFKSQNLLTTLVNEELIHKIATLCSYSTKWLLRELQRY